MSQKKILIHLFPLYINNHGVDFSGIFVVKFSLIVLKPFYTVYSLNEHLNCWYSPSLKKRITWAKDGNKLWLLNLVPKFFQDLATPFSKRGISQYYNQIKHVLFTKFGEKSLSQSWERPLLNIAIVGWRGPRLSKSPQMRSWNYCDRMSFLPVISAPDKTEDQTLLHSETIIWLLAKSFLPVFPTHWRDHSTWTHEQRINSISRESNLVCQYQNII